MLRDRVCRHGVPHNVLSVPSPGVQCPPFGWTVWPLEMVEVSLLRGQ